MARWVRAVSRSRSRFNRLVEPLAVLLHSFDESAKKKQFIDEEPVTQREYEGLASRVLDAMGPAIERLLKEESDLLRSRR